MNKKISRLDRRQFIRGVGGFALTLPALECLAETGNAVSSKQKNRFAAFYVPDGVPMPLKKDSGRVRCSYAAAEASPSC